MITTVSNENDTPISTTVVATTTGAVATSMTIKLYKIGDIKTVYLKMAHIAATATSNLSLPALTIPGPFLPLDANCIQTIVTRNGSVYSNGVISISQNGSAVISNDPGLSDGFTNLSVIGLGLTGGGVTFTYV